MLKHSLKIFTALTLICFSSFVFAGHRGCEGSALGVAEELSPLTRVAFNDWIKGLSKRENAEFIRAAWPDIVAKNQTQRVLTSNRRDDLRTYKVGFNWIMQLSLSYGLAIPREDVAFALGRYDMGDWTTGSLINLASVVSRSGMEVRDRWLEIWQETVIQRIERDGSLFPAILVPRVLADVEGRTGYDQHIDFWALRRGYLKRWQGFFKLWQDKLRSILIADRGHQMSDRDLVELVRQFDRVRLRINPKLAQALQRKTSHLVERDQISQVNLTIIIGRLAEMGYQFEKYLVEAIFASIQSGMYGRRDLAMIGRAFLISDPDLALSFWQSVLAIGYQFEWASLGEAESHIIYLFQQHLLFSEGAYFKGLPHLQGHFFADRGSPQPSFLQQQVTDSLKQLCDGDCTLYEEYFMPDVASHVDIYFWERKIVIQVDGPDHFYLNLETGEYLLSPRHECQDSLLFGAGYTVIRVPFFVWDRLLTKEQKQSYLLDLVFP